MSALIDDVKEAQAAAKAAVAADEIETAMELLYEARKRVLGDAYAMGRGWPTLERSQYTVANVLRRVEALDRGEDTGRLDPGDLIVRALLAAEHLRELRGFWDREAFRECREIVSRARQDGIHGRVVPISVYDSLDWDSNGMRRFRLFNNVNLGDEDLTNLRIAGELHQNWCVATLLRVSAPIPGHIEVRKGDRCVGTWLIQDVFTRPAALYLRLPAKAEAFGVRVGFEATYDAKRRFTVHIEGWGIAPS